MDAREKLVILARHSAPEIDPNTRASEWRLSTEGRRRAELLGLSLAEYRPDLVVSSDEPKAIETARIAAAVLGAPAEIAPGIHEHERSRVPHLPSEEFQLSVARLFREPDRLVFGSETADEARTRAAGAIASVLAEHPAKRLVIVTHGTVMALVVAEAKLDGYELWKKLGLPSFAVLELPVLRLVRLVESVV